MTLPTTRRGRAITTQLMLATFVCLATAESPNGFSQLVHRTLQFESPAQKSSHRWLVSKNRNAGKLFPSDSGFSDENDDNFSEDTCDVAFYNCLSSDACTECFSEIKEKDIDWTGVTVDTDCDIVLKALSRANICGHVGSSTSEDGKVFCDTFHTCVVFDDDDDEDENDYIDCDKLESCEWDGKRDSLIGDGVCHDRFMGGCYNSKVCDYDGGDCCEDTCKTPKNSYLECGSDEYMCRNPDSKFCDPTVTLKCPPSKRDDDDTKIKCNTGEALYRIDMKDSFGDGWDETKLTLTKKGKDEEIFSGQLKEGAEGFEYVCLSLDPTCYTVVVAGGSWGRESSWYISPAAPGSPTYASGGGLMQCDFPVAGATSCTNTCTGRSNRSPSNTDDYTDLKEMEKCINERCVIQKEACLQDTYCKKCVIEDVPDECYPLDSFKAVTDCALCKCTKSQSANAFCEKKLAPGVLPPDNKGGGDDNKEEKCSPMEVISGGTAILEFGNCMRDYSITSMLTEEYDQNNFGELDDFEACAHGYNDKSDHGGKTALDCVRVLKKAMEPDSNPDAPTKAIEEIATLVYKEGDTFCDCTKKASDDCPLCPAFFNFKTLLYESLDACHALDQIDCAAWDEFQKDCRPKFEKKFGSYEFGSDDQCKFVHDGCDGAGPFPAFRRFDCQVELKDSQNSWQWYLAYEKKCIQGVSPTPPAPSPAKPTPHEVPKPHNIGPNPSKPSSGEDNASPTYKSPDEKGSSHWFRNLSIFGLLGGLGYFLYKRQADGFNFVRYRRMAPFGQRSTFQDGDMYSGLSLEGSTTFEPPSLPPTPMYMPNNGGYGA